MWCRIELPLTDALQRTLAGDTTARQRAVTAGADLCNTAKSLSTDANQQGGRVEQAVRDICQAQGAALPTRPTGGSPSASPSGTATP
jgi:hypothetical protein